MNCAERRRAEREGRREARYAETGRHGECGCTLRRLLPAGPVDYSECGEPTGMFDPDGVDFPTRAPIGRAVQVEVGRSCGAEYPVDLLVSG